MELLSLLAHPVRLRILQEVQRRETATARQIAAALPDVSAPTLYRQIDRLLQEGALLVKAERKVRGSVERLLAVDQAGLAAAGNGDIAGAAYQVLMGLYAEFDRYARRPDADPARDLLCLRTCSLTLPDERFGEFLAELGAVFAKYQGETGGGKTRLVSLVSVPASAPSEPPMGEDAP